MIEKCEATAEWNMGTNSPGHKEAAGMYKHTADFPGESGCLMNGLFVGCHKKDAGILNTGGERAFIRARALQKIARF